MCRPCLSAVKRQIRNRQREMAAFQGQVLLFTITGCPFCSRSRKVLADLQVGVNGVVSRIARRLVAVWFMNTLSH